MTCRLSSVGTLVDLCPPVATCLMRRPGHTAAMPGSRHPRPQNPDAQTKEQLGTAQRTVRELDQQNNALGKGAEALEKDLEATRSQLSEVGCGMIGARSQCCPLAPGIAVCVL